MRRYPSFDPLDRSSHRGNRQNRHQQHHQSSYPYGMRNCANRGAVRRRRSLVKRSDKLIAFGAGQVLLVLSLGAEKRFFGLDWMHDRRSWLMARRRPSAPAF